jgi:isopenicillin-N synthase
MQRFIEIPTIDISALFTNNLEAKKVVADQIHAVCRNGPGFFHISNHGIDVIKLQNTVSKFFRTLNEAEKFNLAVKGYNKDNSHSNYGFYMFEDTIPEEKFAYSNPGFAETSHLVTSDRYHLQEASVWPDAEKHIGFRDFCEKYYWDMFNLSLKLLQGFSISLGKDTNFFDQYIDPKDNSSYVSFIKTSLMDSYPEVKKAKDGTKLGFLEHQDISLISLAFQTPVPNVQVEIDGEYFDIPVSDEDLLVLCGTYMSYITHDYYPAMHHRVKFVNAERFCMPFFVNLNHDVMIEPFFPNQAQQTSYRKPVLYRDYWDEAVSALQARL